MFFQDAPPDTSGYMVAGYVIFSAIGLIYVLSLAVRRRNLEQDLRMLESIEAERKHPAAGSLPGGPAKTARARPATRRPARKKTARRK
jgi:hypothetical protein